MELEYTITPHFQCFFHPWGVFVSDIISREGFTKFPNFIFNAGLNPHQLSILITLYQHLPKVNPSVERIVKMSGVSINTVHKCFNELEEMNLLGRKMVTGKRTVYLLHTCFKSFITKKLSTTPSNTGGGVKLTPLPNKGITPSNAGSTPPPNLVPKQYKEQYKKQEKSFNNFKSPEEGLEWVSGLMKEFNKC